jgi:hypothetical protein
VLLTLCQLLHSLGSPLELASKQPGQKGKAILQMLQGKAEGDDETHKQRLSVAYVDPVLMARYLSASDTATRDRISCERTLVWYLALMSFIHVILTL